MWIIICTISSILLGIINYKYLIVTILLSITYTSIWYCLTYLTKIDQNIVGTFEIIEKTYDGFIINYKFNKILVKSNDNLNVGDIINLSINSITKTSFFSNENTYINSKGIYYFTSDFSVNVIGHNHSIKEQIYSYFDNSPYFYQRYVPLILFGIKNDQTIDIYNKLKDISIVHLFVISGLHISFLSLLLNKLIIRKRLKSNKFIHFIPLIILIPYLWLLNFSISSLRAFFYIALILINKIFLKNYFNRLDILSIIVIIFVIINPHIIYSYSFILSFLISYVILLILENNNGKYIKTKISLSTWFTSSVLIIFLNEKINIVGLINNFIFSPIIILIYFICLTMFYLKPVLNNLFLLLDTFINFVQDNKIIIQYTMSIYTASSILTIFFLFNALIKKQIVHNEIKQVNINKLFNKMKI